MESILKLKSSNFVPLWRTPWGGTAIAKIKRRYQEKNNETIPDRIGESWEVSTDAQFPSVVDDVHSKTGILLSDFLQQAPSELLGEKIAARFGAHIPLLLKWLDADDVLSVQIHPKNGNPGLAQNECGKPESWLVLDARPRGFVYLGFKEGLSQEQILACLERDKPEECLHKFFPKPLDYISVPTGCVHAVGPGLLLAEPQYVLPQKIGKTWRLSDWGRTYDAHGRQSSDGKPRELHFDAGANAIDWSLPRGRDLEKVLVRSLSHGEAFLGNNRNPFSIQVFTEPGEFKYRPLEGGQFSLFSMWGGRAELSANGRTTEVRGGESLFIAANAHDVQVHCENFKDEKPMCAFFGIQYEAL